jgi:nickel/cobalt transporter (NicO) family protein
MTEMGIVEARLVSLFDSPEVLVVGLLLALGVGALHAVAPGHGKTIAAAYLVAERARSTDAVLLGVVVAAMHTLSVVVLAGAWTALSAASGLATGRLTAWLQVAAAAVVIGVGAAMVTRRVRAGGQHHHHHHHHPPAEVPPTRRGLLLALGAAGGLLPSPSAFLVLVSGIVSGRLGYALALVGAFAVGMALTLAAVGLATVRGSALLARSGGGVLAAVHGRLPGVAAYGVLGGGVVYLGLALSAVAAS